MKTIFNKISGFFLLLLILISCGGSSSRSFKKSAIDKIVVELMNEQNYSVILADMDFDESTEAYKHKYKILIEKPHTSTDTNVVANDVQVIDKPWTIVSDETFNRYKDNLGMTIISKKNGKIDKVASPPGYDNYVGNKRYGHWNHNSSGGSFWVFYGQYRFLSDILMGPRYHYPYSSWNTYNNSYRGRRAYYGSNNSYGTKSTRSSSSTWGKRSSAFKSKVNSRVTKSASRSAQARRSRSSSRYSSSSSRSRSGGFGK